MDTTLKYLENIADKSLDRCKKFGQRRTWSTSGADLHKEVTEFVESLRGNMSAPPKEAADIFLVLLSTLKFNGVELKLVFDEIENQLRENG